MSTRFIPIFCFVSLCFAQNSLIILEHEIRGKSQGAVAVELVNANTMSMLQRAEIQNDGSFVLRDVNPGSYVVRFVGSRPGTIPSPDLQVAVGEETAGAREAPPATVSAQTLASPPSKKVVKYLVKAQHYSEEGNSVKAIEVMKSAPLDAASAPYVHSRIGTEYLKAGDTERALPELEEAVRLAPKESVHHANLAYGYEALGRMKDAEAEARAALELDGTNTRAHFLLGAALADQPERIGEAITHLKVAHRDVPSARFLLAQLYVITGAQAAADREIASFLEVATDSQKASARRWLEVHRGK